MARKASRTAPRRTNGSFTESSRLAPLFQLAALMASGLALGLALWWIDGPPQMPALPPDWGRLGRILRGTDLPYEDVVSFVTGVGWLALGYLAVSVATRTVAQAAAWLTDGALWTRLLLKLSDRLTLSVVRRLGDAAFATALLVSVWTRSIPRVEALVATPQVMLLQPRRESVDQPLPERLSERVEPPCFASYRVIPGDTLWDIARRFYGDGSRYGEIFQVNAGQAMSTGEPFTNPRLIRPGWVLQVPLPSCNVLTEKGHVLYTVRPGDSLWRIAESFLGDGLRWPEVWELNRGRDMGAGRRFADPSLILPGWVLVLPVTPVPVADSPPTEPHAIQSIDPPPVPAPEADRPPEPAAEWQPSAESQNGRPLSHPMVPRAVAAAVGFAAAGAAVVLVRRVLRGRADGMSLSGLSKRLRNGGVVKSDVSLVALAARALLVTLAELKFDEVRLLLASDSEAAIEFAVECPPGDGDALVAARYDLGRRLACVVAAELVGATRVRFKLSRFRRLAGLMASSEIEDGSALLLPIGAADKSISYLNLGAAGNVLLAGPPHWTGEVLSSWVATIAALNNPDDVVFLPTQDIHLQMSKLAGLPHFPSEIEGGSDRSTEYVIDELHEAIIARGRPQAQRSKATLVALLRLPAEATVDNIGTLETVLLRGPELGIHTIVVTETLPDGSTATLFGAVIAAPGFQSASLGSEDEARDLEPWQLIFSLARDEPLVLEQVEVRAERLPILERQVQPSQEEPTEWPVEPTEDNLNDLLEAEGEAEHDNEGSSVANSVHSHAVRTTLQTEVAPSVGEVSRQTRLLVEEDLSEEQPLVPQGSIFNVRCFGAFEVETYTGPVSGWTVQKARELLAYLIARGGAPVQREEVAEALWPEGEPSQTYHTLSNAAYYLRRALRHAGPAGDVQPFVASAQRYYLKAGLFQVDVDVFDAHLRRARALTGIDTLVEFERALALCRGDFLGSEPYEWAEPYRREYQRRFLAAAHEAVQVALEYKEVQRAVGFCQAILSRDPIDEEAARCLMRCYASVGDSNGVRKVYRVLAESLRRELDDQHAEPMPETTAVFKELTERRG